MGGMGMNAGQALVMSCCVSGSFLSDHISIPYLSKPALWSPFFGTWDSRTAESTCCLMTMEILLLRSCCTGETRLLSLAQMSGDDGKSNCFGILKPLGVVCSPLHGCQLLSYMYVSSCPITGTSRIDLAGLP